MGLRCCGRGRHGRVLMCIRWAAQQRACVARRAALSVAFNPACSSREDADAAVRAMMDTCLADTAPLGPVHAAAAP